VYVRETEQLASVRSVFDASGIPDENIVYLHGEVCRRELAVELEGVFVGRQPFDLSKLSYGCQGFVVTDNEK